MLYVVAELSGEKHCSCWSGRHKDKLTGLAVTEAILTSLCWQVLGSVEHGDFGELCPLMALQGRMTVMGLNHVRSMLASPLDMDRTYNPLLIIGMSCVYQV